MVKTLRFHCRGHRFDPWSGNCDPTCRAAWPKKKKTKAFFGGRHLIVIFQWVTRESVIEYIFTTIVVLI